ncbi:butyrophilin subfamily 2 member A2-like, partial [Corapipo altera]|uniref:butyrophilin subfamily 2 member A2-like n=1 Tax=Corapipo altera TaxID=415028 RepID=UPI000FD6A38A
KNIQVLLCFNIQASGLFCCSSGLQSKSLCYIKETARNVLTPGDICLKNNLGFVSVSLSTSGRETARAGYPLLSRTPQGQPGSLSLPAASGSAPLIALERYEHGGIRVACRSAGWYPRPRVLWHDPHGRHLPSLSENATQDKNGLFAAESSIILTRGGNQELSCSVQHLPHTPGQGSALYVSDPFFQDAHPWRIALGVVLVAVATLLIITVCLFKIKGDGATGSCRRCSTSRPRGPSALGGL